MSIDLEKIYTDVAEKADITVDQSRKAVMEVLDQLTAKMPDFEKALKQYIPDFDKQIEKLKGLQPTLTR